MTLYWKDCKAELVIEKTWPRFMGGEFRWIKLTHVPTGVWVRCRAEYCTVKTILKSLFVDLKYAIERHEFETNPEEAIRLTMDNLKHEEISK